MSGLEAFGAVAAAVQLSISFLRHLNHTRNAPKERKRLFEEVTSLMNILNAVRDAVDQDKKQSAAIEAQLEMPLADLSQKLKSMEEKLSRRSRLRDLIWPIEKREVEESLQTIERVKTTCTIILGSYRAPIPDDLLPIAAPIPDDLPPILVKDLVKQRDIKRNLAMEQEEYHENVVEVPESYLTGGTSLPLNPDSAPNNPTLDLNLTEHASSDLLLPDSISSESEISSFGSSIDSVESGASTSTAYSTMELVSAADEFTNLLLNDNMLAPVYDCVFGAQKHMAERFTYKLRSLLKVYANDLRAEAKQNLHQLACTLVEVRARYIASSVRQSHDTRYRELLQGPEQHTKTEPSTTKRTAAVAGFISDIEAIGQSKIKSALNEFSDTDSEDDEDESKARLASLKEVKAFMITSKAYQKLRDSVLEYVYSRTTEHSPFQEIRKEVTNILKTSSAHDVTFWIRWELKSFREEQLDNQSNLGPVLTLTGSANEAYAATCFDYLKTFWPEFGAQVLHRLALAVDEATTPYSSYDTPIVLGNPANQEPSEVSLITVYPEENVISLRVRALRKQIIKLAQLLSWLTCVFRRPMPGALAYSRCRFKSTEEGHFALRPTQLVVIGSQEGSCWCPMFRECVIAQGFPIPSRETGRGLEIPFDVMVTLGRILYPMEYLDGLVLKGRSTILAPVAKDTNCIQWHFMSAQSGSISMAEISRQSVPTLEHVSLKELSTLRAFVGFCEHACVNAGGLTSGFKDCKISEIPMEKWRAHLAREMTPSLGTSGMGYFGFQLGGKVVLPKGLSRVVQEEDSRLEDELFESKTHPCLLFDPGSKIGWLVPELNVVLLIAHVWATQQDDREALLSKLPFAPLCSPGGEAAYQTVIQKGDVRLREASSGKNELTVMVLLKRIFKALKSRKELVIDRFNTTVEIPFWKKRELSGWELLHLANNDFWYRRKTTKFNKGSGGSWYEIATENPDIVVLFSKGLNELIMPEDPSKSVCTCRLPRVPRGQDLLTATAEVLLKLSERFGSDGSYLQMAPMLYLANPKGRGIFRPWSPGIVQLVDKRPKMLPNLTVSDAVVVGHPQQEKWFPPRHRARDQECLCCLQNEGSETSDE